MPGRRQPGGVGHQQPLVLGLQERDEELRKLRAAEESALPAADDDRLAASFEGVLKLTVQEGKEMVLTPEQVCCRASSLQ